MKVSIITICLNVADIIEDTIHSILEQDYCDIEYIIIDGNSSDNTIKIVNKYKEKIQKIISEKDNGIFDAMNKGYKLSSGHIINYLNAGDKFFNRETVSDVVQHFIEQKELDMTFGDVFLVENNRITGEQKYSEASKQYLFMNYLCHQTIFVKRRILELTNGFSNAYKTHSDYEWILNITQNHKINTTYLKKKMCYFDMTGVSVYRADYKELRKIRKQYYGPRKAIYADLIRYYYNCYNYFFGMVNKVKKYIKL